VAALQEEDADVVLLSMLGIALELEAATSPVIGEISSVLPVMMEWEMARWSK
jgi:hypothetical protein